MPAHASEVRDAESDGVQLWFSWSPDRVVVVGGNVTGVDLVGTASSGGLGRSQQLVRDEGRRQTLSVDVVVSAIGLSPATTPFAAELTLARDPSCPFPR
jgi:NADPH-dependent glutamate synthase beta subunit-like oxidoreductase